MQISTNRFKFHELSRLLGYKQAFCDYCISKKSCPFLYIYSLYKNGQEILDKQYVKEQKNCTFGKFKFKDMKIRAFRMVT